jgi:AAA+ ATPase superfamily predicted ATPase
MAFHNRKRELALLDGLHRQPSGQMFVLYGRRRVGKTALLGHWLPGSGQTANGRDGD